jgi:hypothetical protein
MCLAAACPTCVQADVMGVVHVGWATLDKRVREFSANAAAGLTLKEFEAAAAAAEEEQEALLVQLVSNGGGALFVAQLSLLHLHVVAILQPNAGWVWWEALLTARGEDAKCQQSAGTACCKMLCCSC